MRYRILGYISSIVSILSLFFMNNIELHWWRILAISVGFLTIFFFIVSDILEHRKNKLICFNDDASIKKYMYDWISTEGNVSIYSRDLSWVDEKIKCMMNSKGSDLTVCAERESALTRELLYNGVKVYIYGRIGFSPASRFTIIKANRPEKQIAIATSLKLNFKYSHNIYESSNEKVDMWLLQLATDLVDITKCAVNQNKEEPKE